MASALENNTFYAGCENSINMEVRQRVENGEDVITKARTFGKTAGSNVPISP